MRRPAIAVIRDLRLHPVQIWSFPLGNGINRRVVDEINDFALDPQDVQVIELPVGMLSDADAFSILEPLLFSNDKLHGICLSPQISSAEGPRVKDEEAPREQELLAALAPLLMPSSELTMITPFVGEWRLRPYQHEARSALLETNFLLLGDDPGTGKVVIAASALSSLVQRGGAQRALVVCSEDRRRHWERQLATWAPRLVVNSVRNFEGHTSNAWSDPGQVILIDYKHLAEDFERGSIDKSNLEFDVVILADALTILNQVDKRLTSLKMVHSTWRWGLTGGMPRSAQEWVRLFEYILPASKHEELKSQIADPCERYLPLVMRRSKADVAREMPAWNHHELWLDLDDEMQDAYSAALAEERERLLRMGGAAGRKEISDALHRLCQVTQTLEGNFAGPKVRALIELVNEITIAGGKVVVFCHDQQGEMDHLQTALQTFGMVRLDAETNAVDCSRVVDAMRHDPAVRVLLAHVEANTDGKPIEGTSYIVHFDCGLDAESSRQAEWNMLPAAKPSLPVNVFELWIAHTHEEQLHVLLTSRLSGEAMDPWARPRPEWYRPLTIDDWLTKVLQIGSHSEKALASALE